MGKRPSISAAAQRQRILAALMTGPKSTLECRRELDVILPAARVMELRQAGYNILTHWSREPSDCGELHRVARYALLPENKKPD